MGEKQESVSTAVFKFDMHCSGCAKKVAKHIKKIQGVESVKADSSTSTLVVTGKMDPSKLKEIVEEKTKKPVELVSQQTIKPAKEADNGGDEKKSDDKKPEEKKSEGKADDKKPEEKKSEVKPDDKKPEEKPKEPPVATVQFKTRVHCDGCKDKIKRIVSKYQGVQDVNVDLQKDIITAKGTMNINKLLPYLNLKLKRTVELVAPKKDDGAGGDKKESSGGDKKPKEAAVTPEKPKDGGGDKSEKPKEASGDKKKSGGGDKKNDASGSEASSSKDNATRMEVNKMEHYPTSYDNRYAQVYQPMPQGNGYGYYQPMPQGNGYGYQPMPQGNGYGYQPMPQGNGYQQMPQGNGYDYQATNWQTPEMFSDENPNACSVM